MTVKIHYITRDPWWDTDRTLLPDLTRDYDVTVSVQNGTGNLKYPVKEKYSAKECLEHYEKYHYYDPRILLWTKNYCDELERRSENCDIVFYCLGGSPYYLAMNCNKLDPEKTVIFVHDLKEHSKKHSVDNYLWEKYYRKFRNFAFYSETQRNGFLARHPDKNASLIRMPLKTYGPGTRVQSAEKCFLFFGFVRDYKRLDLFIKAAKKVPGNAKFVIAGSGNWERYTEMIGDDPRFICYKKFIDDGTAADLFTNADFLVLPYDDATQSGPAMTALSYSVPLICSDLPTFRELVDDGSNGFLFRCGDAGSLAEKLLTAAAMNGDEYMSMRTEQAKRAREYSSKVRVSEQFAELIREDFGFRDL